MLNTLKRMLFCLLVAVFSAYSWAPHYTDFSGRFSADYPSTWSIWSSSASDVNFVGENCRWMDFGQCTAYDATMYVHAGLPEWFGQASWGSTDYLQGGAFQELPQANQLSQMSGWITTWATQANGSNTYQLTPGFSGYTADAIHQQFLYTFTSGGTITWEGKIGILIDGANIYSYLIRLNPGVSSNITAESNGIMSSLAFTVPHPYASPPPTDSDNDGVPDVFESVLGGDPNDASDAATSVAMITNLGKNVPAMGGVGIILLAFFTFTLGAIMREKKQLL